MLPATASGIEMLVENDPSQEPYVNILENAQFYARSKADWQDCSTGLCEAGGKIFSNQMSVQDALDEVQALLRRLILLQSEISRTQDGGAAFLPLPRPHQKEGGTTHACINQVGIGQKETAVEKETFPL